MKSEFEVRKIRDSLKIEYESLKKDGYTCRTIKHQIEILDRILEDDFIGKHKEFIEEKAKVKVCPECGRNEFQWTCNRDTFDNTFKCLSCGNVIIYEAQLLTTLGVIKRISVEKAIFEYKKEISNGKIPSFKYYEAIMSEKDYIEFREAIGMNEIALKVFKGEINEQSNITRKINKGS